MHALIGLLLVACRAPGPVPDDTDARADVEDTDRAGDTDLEDTDCEPLIAYPDPDGDGWGSGIAVSACEIPDGHAAVAGDCDEARADVHPEADDADCDGLDADCDGIGAADAWFVAVNGDVADLGPFGTFGAPTAWEADRNGVYTFCPGTWHTTIVVSAYDVTLRGLDTSTTIIAAGGAGSVVEVPIDAFVRVEGLTLRGGDAEHGGGLSVDAPYADVTLRDAIVEHNTASGRGGGVYVGSGKVVVQNTQLRDNTAAEGGGIAGDGVWTVANSRISGNLAVDGGGAWIGATRPTIVDSRFASNSATNAGGGLWVGAGGAILEDTAVAGNGATHGGGLFVVGLADIACLTDGSVVWNAAEAGGAAWVTPTGTLYSTVCDWGSDTTDNTPSDVHLEVGDLVITDLGAASSFRCDGNVAVCEPR